MCRKAIPRETSRANFTACVWSTTKSGEKAREHQGLRTVILGKREIMRWKREIPPRGGALDLLPSCS